MIDTKVFTRFALTCAAAFALTTAATLSSCSKGDDDPPAPEKPVITVTTQPTAPAGTIKSGLIPADTKLTVAASVTESATLSYQWYTNTSASNSGGAAIDGATEANYTLVKLAEGTHYLFCEVRAEGAAAVRTNVVTVTVAPAPRNLRMTWRDGKYALTDDPTDAGLLFMFGSVVGVFSDDEANLVLPGTSDDFFDALDIAWNPTGYTKWNDLPYYNAHPASIDATYHTVARVKEGRGDPCRLAGLDLNKIKTTAAGSLTTADIDNGLWRLPTQAENTSFANLQSQNTYTDEHWTTKNGVSGGMFPNVTSGSDDTFLPATGSYRASGGGEVKHQGTIGVYWSATPSNAEYGRVLGFSDKYIDGTGTIIGYRTGIFVRCVRQ